MQVDAAILTQFVIESNAIEGIPAKAGMYHEVHLKAAEEVVKNFQDMLLFDMTTLHRLLGPVFDLGVPVGRFRLEPASVGSRTFPAPRHVPRLMVHLQATLAGMSVEHEPNETDFAFKAWSAHHHFVCIHPFADVNGRVARLLLNAVRLNYGLPWQIVRHDMVSPYYRAIRAYEDEVFRPAHTWAYDAV